jgi:hypothetical protein
MGKPESGKLTLKKKMEKGRGPVMMQCEGYKECRDSLCWSGRPHKRGSSCECPCQAVEGRDSFCKEVTV